LAILSKRNTLDRKNIQMEFMSCLEDQAMRMPKGLIFLLMYRQISRDWSMSMSAQRNV